MNIPYFGMTCKKTIDKKGSDVVAKIEDEDSTNSYIYIVNPATEEVEYKVRKDSKEDLNRAIKKANNSFINWSQLTSLERSNFLMSIYEKMSQKREYLAKVITKEMGKPIKDSRGEVSSAMNYFRWYAEEARRIYGETIPSDDNGKKILVVKQPVGVIAAITPWNFPLAMAARKIAPALAAGCTVVLRPSSKSPQSAIELQKIFEDVEIPKGVLNVINLDSETTTKTLMQDKSIRKVTFTGSTEVGKLLMKKSANTVKRISMELGGHAPFVVFDDVDVENAAEDLIKTKFRGTGQMCTATNRVYLQKSIADKFIKTLTKKISKLEVGNGVNEQTDVGPLINKSSKEKIQDQIKDAIYKGAELISGKNEITETGNFIEPTILNNVTATMKIYKEETFGPVAPIITFDTEEELMNMVNHENYGLASYLYTNDLSRAVRVSEKMEYGMIGINDPLPFVVQSPFGGVKESGIGKEGGHQGIREYLEEKFISIKQV